MDDNLPGQPGQQPASDAQNFDPIPPPKILHGTDLADPAPHRESLPDPIKITHTDKYSEKNDPPMVDLKVTNPVTYLKSWLKRLLKNEGIDIRIKIRPLTFAAFALALTASFGTGFNVARIFFPNSSPLLNREVSYQGIIQKTEAGQHFLSLPDSSLYKLTTNSQNALGALDSSINKQAIVKGNLGREPNVIDVREVTAFAASAAAPIEPAPTPVIPPNTPGLPELYSGLTWESTQKRVLVFTSGKRRVEEEGIYLESIKLAEFPQDFMNYYLKNLVTLGFDETLNSDGPEGKTLSFEKSGLYLTYGVKNIYQGSGEKKVLTGFKAFVEHN